MLGQEVEKHLHAGGEHELGGEQEIAVARGERGVDEGAGFAAKGAPVDRVASMQRDAGDVITDIDGELIQAMREQFAEVPAADHPADADLIAAAFELLAADPQHAPAMKALSQGPQARSFTGIEMIAVGTVALIALQSHVRIERTSTGKWRVLVEKKPTSEQLLTRLIAQLFGRWLPAVSGSAEREREPE